MGDPVKYTEERVVESPEAAEEAVVETTDEQEGAE